MKNKLLFCLIFLVNTIAIQANNNTVEIPATDVLQNGYAVVSCYANSGTETALAIVDMAQAGTLHDDPANHGAQDMSASFPKPMEFSLNDFGGNQVMATAIDSRDGTIYVGTTSTFNAQPGFVGMSQVYRISPDGSTVELFATLPGNNGGGWLDIDETHNQIYFSNFDDGMIYTVPLGAGPNIPSTYAYNTFAPYPSQGLDDGVAPLGMRIFGVGYNHIESRLYYAIWARDFDVSSGLDNTVRSVAIDANGNFLPGTDVLEITQPNEDLIFEGGPQIVNTSTPVSDIEFNEIGTRMLLAEQSYNSVIPLGSAHASRIIEANGSTGGWVMEPITKHEIGNIATLPAGFRNHNARGGVDFLYHDIDGLGYVNGREDYIVATGDALPLTTAPFNAIYGFQIHPITGGDQTSSIKVDLDGNPLNILDKFIYGDVDVRVAPICPDVALTKYVDDDLVEVGESVTFTIVVENLDAPVSGTTVFDPLPAGLTYNGVYTATTGSYDGTNWTIGTMSNGQKDSIQITAVVNAEGVILNSAVVSVNEIEDNIFNNEDKACVSVPVGACENEEYQYELVGQADLMNYQWYKDGVAISGETMQSYIVTEPGSYTYTADGLPPTGDCAGELCCPVIIEEVSCCAPIKCIPVNLTLNPGN